MTQDSLAPMALSQLKSQSPADRSMDLWHPAHDMERVAWSVADNLLKKIPKCRMIQWLFLVSVIMNSPDIIPAFKQALKESLEALKGRLSGVRTSRASPNLLEPLVVEAYGGRMPLSQLATVSAPEARTLLVQVWDSTVVPAVQKALAQFGMNPSTEGTSLRVHLPELTQERRKEYVKMAKDHAEHTRIGIRNGRRECLDGVTKDLFSEDQIHALKKDVQKMTDDAMAEVDRLMEAKEKEIMQVV